VQQPVDRSMQPLSRILSPSASTTDKAALKLRVEFDFVA
jgi:hypothetical protein